MMSRIILPLILAAVVHGMPKSKETTTAILLDENDYGEVESATPSCEDVCEAQFKADFHIKFQKSFDANFFDVPIDTTIISSKEHLTTLCELVNEKYACYKEQCDNDAAPWSPEKQVCQVNYDSFIAGSECLKASYHLVHGECSIFCDKLNVPMSQKESDYFSWRKPKVVMEIMAEHKACGFISCHRICHDSVIEHKCTTERAEALRAVGKYYGAYMKNEYDLFAKVNKTNLFPSFCKKVTPGISEISVIRGSQAYNNLVLKKMKEHIRRVVHSQAEDVN